MEGDVEEVVVRQEQVEEMKLHLRTGVVEGDVEEDVEGTSWWQQMVLHKTK